MCGREVEDVFLDAGVAERGVAESAEVTPALLARYQRALFAYRKPDGAPLTLGSQFGCLSPLRTWFKWLAGTGALPADPAARLALGASSKPGAVHCHEPGSASSAR